MVQLTGRVSPEVTPQLEVHRLGKLDPNTTVTTLKNLVPDAQLVPDVKKRQLVAVATADDQETIRKTLAQLSRGVSPEVTPLLI